jgi:hypothetical protein
MPPATVKAATHISTMRLRCSAADAGRLGKGFLTDLFEA